MASTSTDHPEQSQREDWTWPSLREAQRAILLDVLLHGRRSRAELGRRIGMTRASLSRLTRELSALGLVAETGVQLDGARGRPSETLEIAPEGAQFLGFKLTGTSLYTALTDLSAQVVLIESEQLPSREVGDVVDSMRRATDRLRERAPRLAAIGVCLAGDVHREPERGDVVSGSSFLGWEETPLQQLLVSATGLPVTISNDVQALTTAHHWFGAGHGTRSLAVLGVGEGIGCGIVVDGRRVHGAHGRPGKVGHLAVGGDARCDQGHRGCVSAYATVPAMLRAAGASDFAALEAAARSGDERADRAFRDAAAALGTVIATLASLIDIERVVVTGEALAVAQLHRDTVDAALRARLDPVSVPPEIVLHPFRFTDYAWGAAVTAIHSLV
ncbi:transcriptional regulator/sugar kinase [Brachybacterium faecium DSM 4810]|uniref:Transcriptional regulator/sugar kinase n=1 Tax=Brachybacterium faecium (strain ATCC 43885 / DSM 4810 / JCM 11609 / LMG 19847 / NBRC 14762 / NCIMB 9860 / 6-10) TaxID=446465 RepID=C7MD65_BRAFD|nr:ROK family transcriptional regulator [Brachybacterium faecium]ACU85522.1 transcriptional regulator/sugar kinase [Brachybacterium faecium DSM 4810]